MSRHHATATMIYWMLAVESELTDQPGAGNQTVKTVSSSHQSYHRLIGTYDGRPRGGDDFTYYLEFSCVPATEAVTYVRSSEEDPQPTSTWHGEMTIKPAMRRRDVHPQIKRLVVAKPNVDHDPCSIEHTVTLKEVQGPNLERQAVPDDENARASATLLFHIERL
jgi:hypothetical protein